MNDWILIVFLLSPGGDFMDKFPVTMPNQVACNRAIKELPSRGEHPMGVQFRGICVTRAHWEGREVMPNVPLEPTFR